MFFRLSNCKLSYCSYHGCKISNLHLLYFRIYSHLVFVYKWKSITFFNKKNKNTLNRGLLKTKTARTITFSHSFFRIETIILPKFISREISIPFSPVLCRSLQTHIFSEVVRRNAWSFYHEGNVNYGSLWLSKFDYVAIIWHLKPSGRGSKKQNMGPFSQIKNKPIANACLL